MFFIYLSHDDKLMDECVRIADGILADFPPSDLSSEVEFYNTKDFAGIERQIPESIDLESSRRQRRQAADAAPRGARANGTVPDWVLKSEVTVTPTAWPCRPSSSMPSAVLSSWGRY